MGVNKVVYDGDTLIDLTGDTVNEATLVKGATAHNAAGERIVGEAEYAPIEHTHDYLPLSGGAMTGAIDASGTGQVLDFGTTGYFRGRTASGNRFDIFGLINSTRLQIGGSYPALELKGKNTRPTYNNNDVALLSDVPKSTTVTATLSASGWSNGSYTLSVSGVTATSNQELIPALNITAAQLAALQEANIQDGGQEAGRITLKAFGTVPTIDVPIRIIVRGDA